MPIATEFMPAETAPLEEVRRQHALLAADPVVKGTLEAMLNLAVILNRQRQVVYANKALVDLFGLGSLEALLGQRTGDLFGCRRACEAAGGCGTTKFCRRCGAGRAVASALSGAELVDECRISTVQSGEDLDLRVRTTPFSFRGEEFVIAAFQDISAEKRREALERIFFHDIANTAGAVNGIVTLMTEARPAELPRHISAAAEASARLVEQILSQRDLYAAERGELRLKLDTIRTSGLLRSVANIFGATAEVKGIRIAVDVSAGDLAMVSDRTLLSRVLGNLLKNAIEAERSGATVSMACRRGPSGPVFTVHNPTPMSEDAGLQVFQRSFSTKGPGRGLGTYGIRLLTENYLGGKISFTSDAAGTVFTAEYPDSLANGH